MRKADAIKLGTSPRSAYSWDETPRRGSTISPIQAWKKHLVDVSGVARTLTWSKRVAGGVGVQCGLPTGCSGFISPSPLYAKLDGPCAGMEAPHRADVDGPEYGMLRALLVSEHGAAGNRMFGLGASTARPGAPPAGLGEDRKRLASSAACPHDAADGSAGKRAHRFRSRRRPNTRYLSALSGDAVEAFRRGRLRPGPAPLCLQATRQEGAAARTMAGARAKRQGRSALPLKRPRAFAHPARRRSSPAI